MELSKWGCYFGGAYGVATFSHESNLNSETVPVQIPRSGELLSIFKAPLPPFSALFWKLGKGSPCRASATLRALTASRVGSLDSHGPGDDSPRRSRGRARACETQRAKRNFKSTPRKNDTFCREEKHSARCPRLQLEF